MSLWLIESALKMSVILFPALIAGHAFKGRSAAFRHWMLALALACAGATPLLMASRPSWLRLRLLPDSDFVGLEPWSGETTGSLETVSTQDTTLHTEFSMASPRSRFRSSDRADALLRRIWTAGGSVSGLILLMGLARLRRLASRARAISDGPWWTLGEQLRRAYGLPAPIRILQSGHPALLATWGLHRPKVLVPAGAEAWPEDRIRVVLAHEFAHIARGDWAAQLLAQSLCALYWFNPLFWIAARRLRAESERACDDNVLARGIDGPEYAAHLLALARSVHISHQGWLPAPAMARASSLEGRIRAMLTTTLNRRPPSWSTRAFSLAAMLALSVGVAALGAQSRFYSLRGTVLDPTNRVLPDTRLVLTNEASRAKYEVRSDATGRYEFAGVPPGTYTLESLLPGFRPVREVMEIVRNSELDLRLRVGSLQETITVRRSAGSTTTATSTTAPDREEVRRRGMEFVERARAQCAVSGTTTSVGGNILPPRKLFDARPVYPDHLKAANMGGTVTMDALIGTDGTIQDIQNLKGPHPDLEASAADAVRQWLFSTTLLNCEPIEVEMKVTTTFNPTP